MSRQDTIKKLRDASPMLTVGVLTADMMSLGEQIDLVQQAGVEMLHFDVMDGRFCPFLTFGPAFVAGVKTTLRKDVHLMIEEPLDKLESFVKAGADMITVNIESCRHIHRVLQVLGTMENVNDPDRGLLRGIVLNPGTPLESINPLLGEVDVIFLLAVNPGWGGQKFIESTKTRLLQLRKIIESGGMDILVGLDGGVNRNNISEISKLADIIVAGSAVFDGKAPKANAEFMIQALKK